MEGTESATKYVVPIFLILFGLLVTKVIVDFNYIDVMYLFVVIVFAIRYLIIRKQ